MVRCERDVVCQGVLGQQRSIQVVRSMNDGVLYIALDTIRIEKDLMTDRFGVIRSVALSGQAIWV